MLWKAGVKCLEHTGSSWTGTAPTTGCLSCWDVGAVQQKGGEKRQCLGESRGKDKRSRMPSAENHQGADALKGGVGGREEMGGGVSGADDDGGGSSLPLPRGASVTFKKQSQDRPPSTSSSAAASAAPTRPGTSASAAETVPSSRPSTSSSSLGGLRPGISSRPTTSSLTPHSEADEDHARAGDGVRGSAAPCATMPPPRRLSRTL